MGLISNIGILFLVVIYIIYSLNKKLKNTYSLFNRVYIILFTILHFSISFWFAYFLNRLTTINDFYNFYNLAGTADNWFSIFGFGHQFISFIIYPLVKLNVSIEILFLLFSTISFKGFLVYFELININGLNKNNRILLLSFLLPTLHFWTGFLGKEALLLFLMAKILKKLKYRLFDLGGVFLLLLIFLIRPHVFFVLMIALLVLLLLDRGTSSGLKKKLILIVIGSFLILLPIAVLYFLKIENFNLITLKSYITGFLNYTENKGSTSISLIETNLISRVFYLIFMPLPFLYTIKNELQLIASVENVFFLVIFLYTIFCILRSRLKSKSLRLEEKFALIAGILLIILFASYLYNLGLGNRMRIMFLPYLFYFFISSMNRKKIINE